MRILITNDDGIYSEGIYCLAKQLQSCGEVIIIAPDSERSATGHAITIHHPLRANKVKFFDTDLEAYSVNGTPADCVKLGIEVILKSRTPDIVVSGINNGPNLGTDVIYSGTVSAAVEAAILDIPSMAVSMGSSKIDQFNDGAIFACKIVKKIFHNKHLHNIIVNVNYPTVSKDEIRGVKITTLGIRKYENPFVERKDPRGNSYYWVSGTVRDIAQKEESDIAAIQNNYISITPIHFDLTHFEHFEQLKKWNFDL